MNNILISVSAALLILGLLNTCEKKVEPKQIQGFQAKKIAQSFDGIDLHTGQRFRMVDSVFTFETFKEIETGDIIIVVRDSGGKLKQYRFFDKPRE